MIWRSANYFLIIMIRGCLQIIILVQYSFTECFRQVNHQMEKEYSNTHPPKSVGQKNEALDLLHSSEWVTLVTVSTWYNDMFENWLHWFNLLELDMKLIVIAEDDDTFTRYRKEKLFTVLKMKSKEVNCFR